MKPGDDPFPIKNFLLFETNITAHLYLAAHPLYTMSYRYFRESDRYDISPNFME